MYVEQDQNVLTNWGDICCSPSRNNFVKKSRLKREYAASNNIVTDYYTSFDLLKLGLLLVNNKKKSKIKIFIACVCIYSYTKLVTLKTFHFLSCQLTSDFTSSILMILARFITLELTASIHLFLLFTPVKEGF